MMTGHRSSFKPSWKPIAVSITVAIYLAINFFGIGGNVFVINLNNFIVIPLALGLTLLAFMLWRPITVGSHNRLLWTGLTMGWAMWTIAELWWAVAVFFKHELPYPSWADFFWLAGYIPMFIALSTRIRSLPKKVDPAQRIGVWAISLVIVAWTILFVFMPIIQNSDPTAILESVLNIVYPLADLILLILVLQILFSYQQGMYGQAWIWLALGFIVSAFGDLVFAYATVTDQYYPDQQINLLSTFGVDIPYNLSYLFMLVGLFIIHSIQGSHHTFEVVHIYLQLVPNTHLLVITKGDDTILDVSRNYAGVFPEDMIKGKTIREVLGISPEDADVILKELKANKIFKERMFPANTRLGREQVLISGMATSNPQGEYSSAYLLLRMLARDYSLDNLLTDDEKEIISSVSSKTGTRQKEEEEIKHLVGNYYQAHFKALYNRVFAEGGSIMADVFLTKLRSISWEHDWYVGLRPDTLLDVSALSPSETQEALPVLFETAKRFVIEIIDESSVDMIVQDVRSKFDEITLENISHFQLAKQERI